MRGRIRGSATVGPVLDVKVCYHYGRYGVEIMIESSFRDRTTSWLRIVSGINKCVTGNVRSDSCCKCWGQKYREPVARARPRPTPTLTLTAVSIFYRERKWIDIEPGAPAKVVLKCQIFMIRLLRHDESVHREDDGAVRFDDLAELLKSGYAGTSHW